MSCWPNSTQSGEVPMEMIAKGCKPSILSQSASEVHEKETKWKNLHSQWEMAKASKEDVFHQRYTSKAWVRRKRFRLRLYSAKSQESKSIIKLENIKGLKGAGVEWGRRNEFLPVTQSLYTHDARCLSPMWVKHWIYFAHWNMGLSTCTSFTSTRRRV